MTLRLVKVIVQPVFVHDDGETLTEVPTTPAPVSAREWPSVIDLVERERQRLEAEL